MCVCGRTKIERHRCCRGHVAWFGPALLVLLAGCASEGPLRPPSLHLPAAVRGLRAERTGDAVTLAWTAPVRTSDGVSLIGKHGPAPVTVEICRRAAPAEACLPLAQVRLVSGQAGSWAETLPPTLATGPARPLTYQVRALNRFGKGVQPTPVEALAGAAPHPVLLLSAMPVSRGVALHWQPDKDPGADHIQLEVTRDEATAGADAAKGKPRPALLSVEVHGADAGGALDTGARLGVAQFYTVQRTRTVHLPAGADLVMKSAPAHVAEQANALPQPLPPATGLEAVVTTLALPEVALVWDPVEGAAGYLLFRAAGTGNAVPLTTVPITGFTFTDAPVKLGQRLRYSIATVDSSGQVGPHSAEVLVETPLR